MRPRLDATAHPWMTAPATQAVMDALTAEGGDARFVGGAVRNTLMGIEVTDIDIATPLTPPEVTRLLKLAGIEAVPTGITHGTVTAICGGQPFEVTSLRRDVSTDGRRAVIAFTTDWKEDAARRDFTINALYATRDGTLFDYIGGLEDLREGRVRFLGDARERIREDYLRILRLFRFQAWYGRTPLDADAVAAVADERAGLRQLSGERVQKEMLRLLAAADPLGVLAIMEENSILNEIVPAPAQLGRLRALLAIETYVGAAPDSILRLAALLPESDHAARELAERWRLSNADRTRLIAADTDAAALPTPLTEKDERSLLYRWGSARFRDAVLLQWAGEGGVPGASWRAHLDRGRQWVKPRFPLGGHDAMALGIPEGPKLGAWLKSTEDWWLEENFVPSREMLLEKLRSLSAKRD
jgi:poly(A) polymerase